MDTIRICKKCQEPLPENAPEGLCPKCLAMVAIGTEPAAGQGKPAPAVAELAPHFPQLEIIELLGMGGMGIVYKARQARLDRLVALKILPVDSAPHPSFAERFNREARALAKLNHPGIVDVYDFGQAGPYYYFVMEYVDGMNLRELLNQQTVMPRQALELVVQICAALQYAHDEGVVHRDIKPENILLNKKGHVKIADFGLAKLLGAAPDTSLTVSQAAMGTLNYMAPEQRQNAQGVDHRADIYSLGVVFYEMLTGEVPMGRFDPPSKKVQVDVRLDEVVLRALEREPGRRYQQASEVKTDVESVSNKPGATVPPVIPPPTVAAPAVSTPQPTRHDNRHIIAREMAKVLGLTAVTALAMSKFGAGFLILLFMKSWAVDSKAAPNTKQWVRTLWIVCVIALAFYGMSLSQTVWPALALLFIFDWQNEEEKEDEEEEDDEIRARIPFKMEHDGGAIPTAAPFIIDGVRGPFGKVSGLMRLEASALALEFEVKSIFPSVREKLREVRIPYKEIVLVDFDLINRLVLRTDRTSTLADVPKSDKGQLVMTVINYGDGMTRKAAEKFAWALNRRITEQAPKVS